MLGTCFIVVLPEALMRGCECEAGHSHGATEGHLEVKNIGLAAVIGFIMMVVADSFSHGNSDHHNHDCDSHDNDSASEDSKEEVVINMSERNIKKLNSSIYGLCLHSLFDGLAIGSSISSANPHVVQTIFWAILLHKISASLGTGIFIRQLHLPINHCILSIFILFVVYRPIALFSAATPVSTVLSAVLVHFSANFIPIGLLGYAFAFSAGTFLHVALMHILPTIGHHVGFVQILIIFVGVMIPYLLFMEHEH